MRKLFDSIPTLQTIVDGIENVLKNSVDLHDRSLEFFHIGKYNLAAFMSLSAKQELGKVKLLHFLSKFAAGGLRDERNISKSFFSHSDKNALSDIIDSLTDNETTMHNILDVAGGRYKRKLSLGQERLDEEEFRQRCIYVDFIKSSNEWHQPGDIVIDDIKEIIDRTSRILNRTLAEKEMGFYSLDYYNFIEPFQTSLLKKYLQDNGEIDIPESDLGAIQEFSYALLNKAQESGIIKKGIPIVKRKI